MTKFRHTEETKAEIELFLDQGYSMSQTANIVSKRLGIKLSKNAVISIARRMKRKAVKQDNRVEPRHVEEYSPKKCQWPHGHPGEKGFHFCGAPVEPGKPYCTPHCQRAYRRGEE